MLAVHCRGGVMYMRAVDWKTSMKDKINLEGPKLKEKQGLYTCPPERPGDQPFHCCLEVKEDLIKVCACFMNTHVHLHIGSA